MSRRKLTKAKALPPPFSWLPGAGVRLDTGGGAFSFPGQGRAVTDKEIGTGPLSFLLFREIVVKIECLSSAFPLFFFSVPGDSLLLFPSPSLRRNDAEVGNRPLLWKFSYFSFFFFFSFVAQTPDGLMVE